MGKSRYFSKFQKKIEKDEVVDICWYNLFLIVCTKFTLYTLKEDSVLKKFVNHKDSDSFSLNASIIKPPSVYYKMITFGQDIGRASIMKVGTQEFEIIPQRKKVKYS